MCWDTWCYKQRHQWKRRRVSVQKCGEDTAVLSINTKNPTWSFNCMGLSYVVNHAANFNMILNKITF